MNTTRSNRADVRNPVCRLPAAAKIAELPPEAREALAAVLRDLSRDARDQANHCWKKHKAPMAAYWKAVAVYAGHCARLTARSTA
jgi:truncated hemoglobin YjbI